MKITCLCENTSKNENLSAEHGLSLYIETRKYKILFDMGQSDLFYENAVRLGVDLSAVDFAVLSHGHYDHGGGLHKFLEINKSAPVYINRYAFGEYFNASEKYIGLDPALKESNRIIFTDSVYEIDECITLYSCNEKERKHNLGSFGLTKKSGGQLVPDDFLHEQYLLIEEDGRKTLISGCSHKGITDITEWFDPDTLVGGFHFSKLPTDGKLKEYSQFLDSFKAEFYTCHCTGTEQFTFMKSYMKRLNYLSCGDIITI